VRSQSAQAAISRHVHHASRERRRRAGHVLDRHVGIDPVLVKQVDVVGAQPAQRALERFADVFRPAV